MTGDATQPNGKPVPVSLSQVQRPLLPKASVLAPYLDRIDTARWYSNRGPLLWELERRLGDHLRLAEQSIVLLSSGSAALEAAILAHAGTAGADRPLALMPSYTFIATALSAMRCGYTPYFVDVEEQSWMLDPDVICAHPALARAGLIMPVATYGRVPDLAAWAGVQSRTGVPVVVDAAAAFEQFERDATLVNDTVPAVLSLHATKTFSTAEGGAVLWGADTAWERIAQVTNFGMSDARRCEMDGFNGKLSEYHAAIGLAQLDLWTDRSALFETVAHRYAAAAEAVGSLPGVLRLSPEVSGAYAVIDCTDGDRADRVCAALAAVGIGSRRWYGRGLHGEPLLKGNPQDPMPVTERLSANHIGLPAAVDLTEAQISQVVETLSHVN
ncbi:MAG: DegT/DnrJ/EryC1/StrS family aminotransferase [Pseudomonadota bacterium]